MSDDPEELSSAKPMNEAGLEHFCDKAVLVETDDEVTQAYINHLEGRSMFLSSHRPRRSRPCAIAYSPRRCPHQRGQVDV